jgi:hypothetical protein
MSKEQKYYKYAYIFNIQYWQNDIHLNKSEEIFLQLRKFVKFSRRTYLSSDMYKM